MSTVACYDYLPFIFSVTFDPTVVAADKYSLLKFGMTMHCVKPAIPLSIIILLVSQKYIER